ncbi:hypothetical protein FACS1894161_0870 [Spirochaetia bacterium]|nr:hypothetical protein FACS1894161_0870 [Spirochaetia bacterium]
MNLNEKCAIRFRKSNNQNGKLNQIREKKDIDEISIENASDIFDALHYLLVILEGTKKSELLSQFEEIYKKANS